MKTPETPFPTTGYFGPEYFCDREDELAQLKLNIKGGNSTTLIALRRLGKTALIKHLFHYLHSKYNTIYLDILSTESLGDLVNRLSTSIASQYSENTSFGKKVWSVIKSFRPVVSYDPLSGAPLISINASADEGKKTIEHLLGLLEGESKPAIIAIDEFQQILAYPEKQTDAWLRSIVQQLSNVNFVFSGSQQHLMKDLFSNPNRPFFRSAQFMKLEKLDAGKYRDFIIKQFSRNSKIISEETVKEILDWTDLHTYYVQLLCNRVFLSSGRKVTNENWKDEAGKVLKEQEFVFFGYRDMLTRPQWDLLKAVAMEGRVYQPTSGDFVSRYILGNPATVLRSLNSLQKMELIYRETDINGKSYYGLYDILFRRWVARL